MSDRITLSQEQLEELDSLYNETVDMGVLGRRPTRWGELVARPEGVGTDIVAPP